MIHKIEHIKGFGVFADFKWPASLSGFKRFNLVYGFNYSGKTTLSRAFRCFEQQRCHFDFATAQVQFKNHDGAIYELSAPPASSQIRVFNSDFVRENLGFDSGSASPILVLGSEDIAKQ